MSLLLDLLLLPVMGPVRGVAFIAEQAQEAAEAELLNEDQIQGELLSLSLQRDMGMISEAEYDEFEIVLLEQLEAIRVYKESLGDSEPTGDDQW
jgi:hypothetical protein